MMGISRSRTPHPVTFLALLALSVSAAVSVSSAAPAPSAASATHAPAPSVASAAHAAIDVLPLLQEYLRIDTSNPPGNEMKTARWLEALLAKDGIPSEILEIAPGRADLIARIRGDGSKKALLLFSHMDVVQADRARWTVDPFAATVKDGYLYARGSLDMKTTGLLQALTMIRLKREGIPLARDIILVASSDEEVDSIGMTKLIEMRPELFKGIELAITEGDTIDVESGRTRSWSVDVSEKAALWLRLTATGEAGHGSIPFKKGNAVESLLAALEKVRRYQTPLIVQPTVARFFAALKDGYPDLPAARLANLEASLRDPAFREAFLAERERAALVRNTIAITVLKGGPQTNVIPSTASAELDCRLLPGQDPEAFTKEIAKVVADPSIKIESITPVFPASSSPTDSDLFRAIEKAAAKHDPGIPVVPTILTGWTESSLMRPLGIASYGFEPFALDKEENRRTHGDDERISLENVRRATEIVYEIVKDTAGKIP